MPGETGYTTITVPEPVKEDLNAERNGQPWGSFLEELRREHADPITLNDAQEIAEQIKAELEGGDVSTNGSDVSLNVSELAERVAKQVGEQSVTVELGAEERSKIARDVAEELR